jgi:pimeloyl-ACP methyl ester carboxylesterase
MGFDRTGLSRAALAVSVKRHSIVEKLDRITAPTLVMCGREDQATTLDKSEEIAARIPGSKLVVLDGLGHMSPLEDTDAVNAHLVPFVRERVMAS